MCANFILFQITPIPPTSQSYQMCFVKDTLPSIAIILCDCSVFTIALRHFGQLFGVH